MKYPLSYFSLPGLVALAFSLAVPTRAQPTLPSDVYPGLHAPDGGLLPTVSHYLGQDTKPLEMTVGADLLKKRNDFGYTDEEIRKYFSTPVDLTLDETGLNTSLLKPVPAAGIHPRVLFNPEDVPLIRERLAKTRAGQSASAAIRSHVAEILTGPKAKFAADYDALAAGKTVDNLDVNVPFTLMYEAFRCLIDDDKAGGQKAAAAITTLSQIVQKGVEANIAKAKKPPRKERFPGRRAEGHVRGHHRAGLRFRVQLHVPRPARHRPPVAVGRVDGHDQHRLRDVAHAAYGHEQLDLLGLPGVVRRQRDRRGTGV